MATPPQKEKKRQLKSAGKRPLFKFIAFLLPFILLLLVELLLRTLGYGYNLDLFVEDKENKACLVMNPDASKRYFTDEENATIGAFEPFRKRKAKGTLRIFVLGESTTIGYPYMHNVSFHRWLNYRLMRTFPKRQFELINLSLTAVNSYTVLGFAKELIPYEPDAILIYCGQNEYYGALGIGSTSRLGNSRLVVKSLLSLRYLRLVQLLGKAYKQVNQLFSEEKDDTRETLMKRMANNQKITFQSDTFQRGVDQFRDNMTEVCKLFSQHKIPVFISNLVSNEKDLKPFISEGSDTVKSANYHYQIACEAYTNNDFRRAKQEYVQAKDLDLLRFRAPEIFNTIIAELSKTFSSVHLVNTKKLFENYSPHGIIGQETVLEHVHPNIMGYGLMSEAFYQSIKQAGLIKPSKNQEISFKQLRKEMPITMVDSLKGTFEIDQLKSGWPFNQQQKIDFTQLKSFEDKLALDLLHYQISWNDATQIQMNHYLQQGDQLNATKVAESAALEFSSDPTFLSYAGKFCMNIQENEKAAMYYQQTFHRNPSVEIANALAILYLKTDKTKQAVTYLKFLCSNSQSSVNYTFAESLAEKIITCKNKLTNSSLDVPILNQIASNYSKMHNLDIALHYVEKSLAFDARNDSTLELKHKIKSQIQTSRTQND